MIKSILFVGIGSFFGGVLRYTVSLIMKNTSYQGFPWATFSVNLIGCFLLGLIFALFGKYSSVNSTLCLLLATGFLGDLQPSQPLQMRACRCCNVEML